MPEPIRIDVVTDIDAAWHELEPLYFGLHEHHLGLPPGGVCGRIGQPRNAKRWRARLTACF